MHIYKLLSATKHAPATLTVVTWVLAANGEARIRQTTNQRQRRCAPDVISVSPPVINNSRHCQRVRVNNEQTKTILIFFILVGSGCVVC